MKKKHPPGFKPQPWKTAKGEIKVAYYYRSPRSAGRKLIPLGTDYQEALKKWAELHGAQVEPAKAGTVGDIYAKYMPWAEDRSLSKLSPRTIEDRNNYWGKPGSGKLRDVFEHVVANDFKPEWALTYFETRSSQVSAKKELKFLQTMFNWAKSRGLMTAPNPLSDIMRLLSVDEKRDIYVEDPWYDLTFECGTQLVRDTLQFTYLCANRPDETAQAKLTDIDGDELVVKLMKTDKKGLREKRIHIDGELKAYIQLQKRRPIRSLWLVSDDCGQRLKVAGSKFRREFKQARDDAERKARELGIPYTRFQLKDIRAKAGTDIARDYGIEAARLALGHTTQKQTNDYIRSVKGAAAKARKLKGGESGS